MRDKLKDVQTFLKLNGQVMPMNFAQCKLDHADLVKTLIEEEHAELQNADMFTVDHLDGLIDLLYVTMNGFALLALEPTSVPPEKANNTTPMNLLSYVAMAQRALVTRPLCGDACTKHLNRLAHAIAHMVRYYHYDFEKAWKRVHAANMSKFWREEELTKNHTPGQGCVITFNSDMGLYTVKRPDGKVVKPPSFRPPVLTDLVNAARRSFGYSEIPETV